AAALSTADPAAAGSFESDSGPIARRTHGHCLRIRPTQHRISAARTAHDGPGVSSGTVTTRPRRHGQRNLLARLAEAPFHPPVLVAQRPPGVRRRMPWGGGTGTWHRSGRIHH